MSSVNLIQFSELRPQPPQGNPARTGDPFGELLASTSASRPEPEARQRPTEPREEPAAPRTRGDTRREKVQSSHDDGDPVRTADTDRPAESDRGEPRAAKPEAAQSDQTTGSDTGKDSEGQTSQTAAQAEDAVPVEETPVADGDAATAPLESGMEAETASESANAAPLAGEAEAVDGADAAAADETVTAAGEADILVTDVTPGTAATPAVETADAETDEVPAGAPAVDDIPEAGDEMPVAAGKADPTANDEAAQAAAAPAPVAPSADANADSLAPAPVQPTAARSAGSAGDQQPGQPTAQSGVAAQNAANDATMQFGEGGNEQSAQKQPDVPLAQAKAPETKPQEIKPQDAKPHDGKPVESKPATPAETVKPAAPAPDIAAAKSQPDTLPEPVRALAATFNPANVNSITFRNVALNERAPVPLTGTALAAEIVSRIRDGMQRFDIRLDPPELGRVDVRLEVDRNGHVKTHLTVDRPETLDLMQREARGLERALQQAGLKTDSGGLEFSLRSQAENGQADGRPERHGREGNPFGDDGIERADAAAEGYRTAAFARGGVDIRI